jgi:hypothetical protein
MIRKLDITKKPGGIMSVQTEGQELSPEDLAKVSGGEDGGFLHQTEGALGQDDLSKVSGGEDGGFLHQTEGALGQDDLSKVSGGEDGGFLHQTEGTFVNPKDEEI